MHICMYTTMASADLSLRFLTKIGLGEEPLQPKILPGNFSLFTRQPLTFSSLAETTTAGRLPVARKKEASFFQGVTKSNGSSTAAAAGISMLASGDSKDLYKHRTGPQSDTVAAEKTAISRSAVGKTAAGISRGSVCPGNGGSTPPHCEPNTLTKATRYLEETQQGKAGAAADGDADISASAAADGKVSSTEERARHLANKLRCRNVLLAYSLLDPYNQGYVDVQEAAEIIAQIRMRGSQEKNKQIEALAELLLFLMQQMTPFVSSRGVIEKEDFFAQTLSRVEDDLAGTTPYFCLRSHANPLSHAYKNNMTFSFFSRPFYKGNFTLKGVEMHASMSEKDAICRTADTAAAAAAQVRSTAIKKKVWGNLYDHALRGHLRSLQKRALLKKEQLFKEFAECTFQPQTTSLPRSTQNIFPSKEAIREMLRKQAGKKRSNLTVFNDLDETVERTIALPPLSSEEEKKEILQILEMREREDQKADEEACAERERSHKNGASSTLLSAAASSLHDLKAETATETTGVPLYFLHDGDPPLQPLQWGATLRSGWLPRVPVEVEDEEQDNGAIVRKALLAEEKRRRREKILETLQSQRRDAAAAAAASRKLRQQLRRETGQKRSGAAAPFIAQMKQLQQGEEQLPISPEPEPEAAVPVARDATAADADDAVVFVRAPYCVKETKKQYLPVYAGVGSRERRKGKKTRGELDLANSQQQLDTDSYDLSGQIEGRQIHVKDVPQCYHAALERLLHAHLKENKGTKRSVESEKEQLLQSLISAIENQEPLNERKKSSLTFEKGNSGEDNEAVGVKWLTYASE